MVYLAPIRAVVEELAGDVLARVPRPAFEGAERDDADRTGLVILGRLGLQRAHIGDEVIELGIGQHTAGVHLLGVEVPHELDRVAQ